MKRSGAIKRSFKVDGSADRIVLHSWSLSDEPRLKNVARVDQHGNVLWRADLPGDAQRDCFVDLRADGAFFVAKTYSGRSARIDSAGHATAR